MSGSAPMASGHGRSRVEGSRPSPPTLLGVGVDGSSSGLDAVALASLFASATAGEPMLIAVYEEPLLEGVVPGELGWRSVKRQAWAVLDATRDALLPAARMVVEPDVLAWRGLQRVVRREHRDLLVVGLGHRATDGHAGLRHSARELLGQVEWPLAIAPTGGAARTAAARSGPSVRSSTQSQSVRGEPPPRTDRPSSARYRALSSRRVRRLRQACA